MTDNWSDDDTWSADSNKEEAESFIHHRKYSPTSPSSGSSPQGCDALVCTSYDCFGLCPISCCKLSIIVFILFLVILGTTIPLCIKVIFPNILNRVIEEASLSLINSTISATIKPLSLKLSTLTRLKINSPVLFILTSVPLTIQYHGKDVANGQLPQIEVPVGKAVDFSINGLNILQKGVIGDLVAKLIQSNSKVPVEIIANPTMIFMGISYPTNINKTLQLPGLHKFFKADYLLIRQSSSHGLIINIHYSSDNPFPYPFMITNLKLSIDYNGTSIGTWDKKVEFSIETATSNQFYFNMSIMNIVKIIRWNKVNILSEVSFNNGNYSTDGIWVSGNKTIYQENVPIKSFILSNMV